MKKVYIKPVAEYIAYGYETIAFGDTNSFDNINDKRPEEDDEENQFSKGGLIFPKWDIDGDELHDDEY